MILNYHVTAHTAAHPLSPLADEQLLSACLNDARPRAMLWSPLQSLVVPKSYTHFAKFEQAAQIMLDSGWPVYIRQSGGGVVPQLSGVLNLSLCWADYGRPLDLANTAYEHICHLIQLALSRQNIEAQARAVDGSFCDGRYNLAIKNTDGSYIKVVGTAQHWSNARSAAWYQNSTRQAGDPTDWHIALVHALLFIDCNLDTGNEQANRLEELLESPRRYQASKVIPLATIGLDSSRFEQDLLAILMTNSPPTQHYAY